MATAPDIHVLAILIGDVKQVSLHTCIALLQFQGQVTRRSERFQISFFRDMQQALDAFWAQEQAATLTCVEWSLSFDPALLFRMVECPHDLVVGCYPAAMDWSKVALDDKQALEHTGNRYSIGPTVGDPQDDWQQVEHGELGVCRLTRKVLQTIVEHVGPAIKHEGGYVWLNHGVLDGRLLDPHVNLCKLWGGPVYADLKYPVAKFGSMEFVGSVGQRRRLR